MILFVQKGGGEKRTTKKITDMSGATVVAAERTFFNYVKKQFTIHWPEFGLMFLGGFWLMAKFANHEAFPDSLKNESKYYKAKKGLLSHGHGHGDEGGHH